MKLPMIVRTPIRVPRKSGTNTHSALAAATQVIQTIASESSLTDRPPQAIVVNVFIFKTALTRRAPLD